MGPWTIAVLLAVAAVSAGPEKRKKAMKFGINKALLVKGKVTELAAKAAEYREEVISEIQMERKKQARDLAKANSVQSEPSAD